MGIEINGQPLGEYVASQLFQGQDVPAETVNNLVSLLVLAVTFLLSLSLLLFVTWAIIFPLFKLFIPKKKLTDADGKKKKKHNGLSRLLGSVLGLTQGIAVAVISVTVLNGLFFNLSNVAATMKSMQNDDTNAQTAEVTETGNPSGGDEQAQAFFNSLLEYNDSGIRKFINKMGGDKLFDGIVSIEVEEGKKITLTGQIDALRGLVDMGKELYAIQNMNMSGGLNADTAADLAEMFAKLDEINSGLYSESKDAINTLVKSAAGSYFPAEMNLDALDFNTISFANEGQVIAQLSAYKELDFASLDAEQSKQKATEVVSTVMQSDILLPLLSSNADFTVGLEGDNYVFAKEVIDELEQNPESDKDKVNMLKSFFGVNAQ